jgi:hypothetical protein
MASLTDCYPDWETFESSTRAKPQKNSFSNYEGFYPVEGFSNKAQKVEEMFQNEPSNSLNIKYGAPSEYMPAEYNNNTYQQNPIPKKKRRAKKNNNSTNNLVANQNVQEEEVVVLKQTEQSELKREMESIRLLLNDIVDRLDRKEEVSSQTNETTTHDMILFVIFGLFIIFALEGTAKIIANLAKKGKF